MIKSTIGVCRLIEFEAKMAVVIFLCLMALIFAPKWGKIGIGRRLLHSQYFFGNKLKQILSAIADLSAKRKQIVAPSTASSGREKIQL